MIANDTTKSSGGLELNHTKKLTQNIEGVTGQEGRINDTVEEARHILQIRLVSFMKHYEQINDKLEKYCTRLESYSLNGLYQDKRLNQPYSMTIQSYRVKLQSIRVFILRINDKLSRLQCRLNSIRSRLPKGHVYVETGPFPYRCVYKGGVRYRSFPSSAANLLRDKPMVQLDDEVQIAQRVFVTAEESVFLHHLGVGWLLENKGHVRCFERSVEAPGEAAPSTRTATPTSDTILKSSLA